jgi:hypothetical protein
VLDLPTAAAKRQAPASAVTVSPTVVPRYATYCSNPSACKLKAALYPLPPFLSPTLSPILSCVPFVQFSFHTKETTTSKTDSNLKLLTLYSSDYSACSCVGATGVTTTAPTPTVTDTVTTTITCSMESKIKRGLEAVASVMNFGRM